MFEFRLGTKRFSAFAFCAALIVGTMATRPAHSQVLFGSLVGGVTDATGAAVPAASVKVTQIETSEVRETKTNESGGYTLSTIHAGTYKVTVTKEGFKTFNADNIQVTLNTVVRVDASL